MAVRAQYAPQAPPRVAVQVPSNEGFRVPKGFSAARLDLRCRYRRRIVRSAVATTVWLYSPLSLLPRPLLLPPLLLVLPPPGRYGSYLGLKWWLCTPNTKNTKIDRVDGRNGAR